MTAENAPDDRVRPEGSTSRSLLADARLSVPAAWERLVRLYAPLVASWCRRWGVPEQDVVDILQDVFLAVAANLGRFRKERSADTFRGWLATIARNKARDHFRNRATEPDAAGGTDASLRFQQIPEPEVASDSVDVSDDVLLDELLLKALESIRREFQERTWQAFQETVVRGRAAADVAADLGMTAGAVRVAKSRVLHRLRRELGDIDDEPAPQDR